MFIPSESGKVDECGAKKSEQQSWKADAKQPVHKLEKTKETLRVPSQVKVCEGCQEGVSKQRAIGKTIKMVAVEICTF